MSGFAPFKPSELNKEARESMQQSGSLIPSQSRLSIPPPPPPGGPPAGADPYDRFGSLPGFESGDSAAADAPAAVGMSEAEVRLASGIPPPPPPGGPPSGMRPPPPPPSGPPGGKRPREADWVEAGSDEGSDEELDLQGGGVGSCPLPAIGSAPPNSTEEWASVHDTPALHNMLQEDRAEAERSHPDVHPLPPGAFDLPGRVVKLSALEESAATEALDAPFSNSTRTGRLVAARWPAAGAAFVAGGGAAGGGFAPEGDETLQEAAEREEEEEWRRTDAALPPRRLLVLFGGGGEKKLTEADGRPLVDLLDAHPALLANTACLELVRPLSEAECRARGESDTLGEVWRAMEEKVPLVVVDAVWATTRRVRRQILHRLSKKEVASGYVWQALQSGPPLQGDAGPSLEEGWAEVLPREA